jgi:hypothetical protein
LGESGRSQEPALTALTLKKKDMKFASILFVMSPLAAAFLTAKTPSATRNCNSRRMLVPIDPIMVDMGIAVASAAAGVASQLPKIQQLEQDVLRARSALTEASF